MGFVSKPDTCKIISLGSNTDKYSYSQSECSFGGERHDDNVCVVLIIFSRDDYTYPSCAEFYCVIL